MIGSMRGHAAIVVVLALVGGCPAKKKSAPEGAGSGSTAPILQPVENKLDNSMKKNEDRATPEPE
jgi:hypothetical protein